MHYPFTQSAAIVGTLSDLNLPNLLNSAGATIGVIIAGTIFSQFLSSKYLELLGRYRSLAGEYRQSKDDTSRHGLLQAQIRTYHRRLWIISRASWLSAVALLCFLVSVLAGGTSMTWPGAVPVKWIGAAGLFSGLVLIALAVAIELVESILGRHETEEETGDLDESAKKLDKV